MRGRREAQWGESVVFVALGAALLYASYGSLSNLWASYRDSPVVTYVFFGGLAIVAGLACFVLAVLVHVWGPDFEKWPRPKRFGPPRS